MCLLGCRAIDVHYDDRDPAPRIQTVWQVQLDEIEPVAYYPKQTSSPAYGANGRIVVAGSNRGEVVAADAQSGRVRWRFATKGKVRGTPVIDGKAVFVGATDGKLYRLDLGSGAEDWDAPYGTQGAITSKPALGGGKVVFQNNQNRTYAVDAKTGVYAWDQGRPRPEFLTIQGDGGPVISGGSVFAGYEDGYLVAMRLDDGATIWSKSLAADQRQFIDVDTRPVVHGDTVFAASFAVGLYAVGAKHGNVRWLHRARGVQTPAMGDRYLFATTGAGRVLALDPKTGKVQWSARLDYGELSGPTIVGDNLFVPTGNGVVLFDAARASAVARISPDYGQTGAVVTTGGWLHMVTNGGTLVGARLL